MLGSLSDAGSIRERLITLLTGEGGHSYSVLGKILQENEKDEPQWKKQEQVVPGSPYRWIVDHLDGTPEALYGGLNWTVSVGLEATEPHAIIAAAVYLPQWNKLFVASQGKGVFCNGTPLVMPSCPLSETSIVVEANIPLKSIGSQFDPCLALVDVESISDGSKSGSALAYLLSVIEKGRAVVLYNLDDLWDLAMPMFMGREAGGTSQRSRRMIPILALSSRRLRLFINKSERYFPLSSWIKGESVPRKEAPLLLEESLRDERGREHRQE